VPLSRCSPGRSHFADVEWFSADGRLPRPLGAVIAGSPTRSIGGIGVGRWHVQSFSGKRTPWGSGIDFGSARIYRPTNFTVGRKTDRGNRAEPGGIDSSRDISSMVSAGIGAGALVAGGAGAAMHEHHKKAELLADLVDSGYSLAEASSLIKQASQADQGYSEIEKAAAVLDLMNAGVDMEVAVASVERVTG